MTELLTSLTFFCYFATCLRLLLYRRGLANYCWQQSCKAWCLIVFTGHCALELLLHPESVSLGRAGIAVTILLLVFRARGNVASLTRSHP
ncbi:MULTISPECIES: phage holin family protein [unclassified Undibacterium]|uniref:phage holin family protein n=1 Tax=unclassified Undibacterium TaxID=2630295 RepID=UPI002AC934A4|nr:MULTISPECIES: phage holin family protein [unclassified Undibacterium]MEB0138003.1 phage holin family protein [Undibacterium sp. CCC2.1]MEB0170664.1 phage holin family protein [Undibacterium sp. CCC1.1]MEB0177005.1 phage holin family protein [Undibacterium sp. CCC3.4]MEB0216293.1 phage holin family protein [Undibacterium sp. 5I2]WPX42479.1 phage holin family protein [Undibacterium sp. CCC3.4]